MKKSFQEYYPLEAAEKKKIWDEAIFIFDANVLLNLYQYSEKTRKEFLNILDKMKERIWLPHQFALEYQRKRLKVIEEQSDFYSHVSNRLQKGIEGISREIKEKQNQHPFLKIDRMLNKIAKSIKTACKEIEVVEGKHPNWFEKDPIREQIDQLFDGKVGLPCENISEIEKMGAIRIQNSTPPGYADAKKDYPYGDWIGWYQIMKMAKEMEVKKPVILITDDNKKDWWLKKNNKETIGPRPELIKEISQYDVKFHMYTMEKFLEIAKPIYKVKEAAIQEIEEVNKKNTDGLLGVQNENPAGPTSASIVESAGPVTSTEEAGTNPQ